MTGAPLRRLLPLGFAAMALIALWPTLRYPELFGTRYDWRYFQTQVEAARRTVVWWHQMPLWNPWSCGGEVLLANPQSLLASPTFLLPLLFGTALGVKLELFAYLFFAFDGMYRLARDLELDEIAAALSAVLFGTSGWFALHLSSGHPNFATAALFPYLLLCYRRAQRELEWALPLGALAAWVIGLGGTSTPAMAAVLLATVSTIDVVRSKSARPYLTLAAAGGAAALIGAFRLFPTLEFAIDHPRRQWETDRNTVFEMVRNAYWWRGIEPVPHKRYYFHEYGYRLAYLTPPLIVWSLAVRRTRWLWIVAVVGGAIIAGSAIPYGPWWLLHHLPMFRDLRVPSRYAILLALALALLCGGALADLRARLIARGGRAARWASGLALGVVAVCAVDGLLFDFARFGDKIFIASLAVAERGAPFHQEQADWSTMLTHVIANHGALSCDEEAPLQRAAALDEGDVPQVRLLDPGAGEVQAIRWTPNRVEADVALTHSTTVMVNENWNEHWKARAAGGAPARVVKVGEKNPRDRDGGRLGVEAPPGVYTLTVYYRPRSFVVGAAVSAFALPLAMVAWLLIRRRRRRAPAVG